MRSATEYQSLSLLGYCKNNVKQQSANHEGTRIYIYINVGVNVLCFLC